MATAGNGQAIGRRRFSHAASSKNSSSSPSPAASGIKLGPNGFAFDLLQDSWGRMSCTKQPPCSRALSCTTESPSLYCTCHRPHIQEREGECSSPGIHGAAVQDRRGEKDDGDSGFRLGRTIHAIQRHYEGRFANVPPALVKGCILSIPFTSNGPYGTGASGALVRPFHRIRSQSTQGTSPDM